MPPNPRRRPLRVTAGPSQPRVPAESRSNASAVAVERAVDVLFLLADHGESSVTELARAIGSSGSAVHRILVALRRKGLVEQRPDTERYALSWSVLGLARALTERTNLRAVSVPLMTQLRDATGETVSLNVRVGFERMPIDQVESTREVRWVAKVGALSPLYAGATGKVFLAHMSPSELSRYLAKVRRTKLTPHTITERDELVGELEKVRREGVAVSREDRILGLAGISAPIFDRSGAVIAALTIGGRSDGLEPATFARWAEPLRQAAATISELLGHHSTRA